MILHADRDFNNIEEKEKADVCLLLLAALSLEVRTQFRHNIMTG